MGDTCENLECWSAAHWAVRGCSVAMLCLLTYAGTLGLRRQQEHDDRGSRPPPPAAAEVDADADVEAGKAVVRVGTGIARGGVDVGSLLIQPRPVVLVTLTWSKLCIAWAATVVSRHDPERGALLMAIAASVATLVVMFTPQAFYFNQIRHLAR